MAPVKQVTVKFNNGIESPALALGTWQGTMEHDQTETNKAYYAVKTALGIGYRHIDTSPMYMVEGKVGEAIKEKIQEGVLTRAELFVTSKLWCHNHKPSLVEAALKKTLEDLQLEYLDLYLIHWPMAVQEGGDPLPVDKDGLVIASDVKLEDTWKALEDLVKKGLTRSIGLSNFNSVQVERILKVATIKPVTNQIECHPYLIQEKLSKFCTDRGIKITSYAPLGSPGAPWATLDVKGFLEDQKIKDIAQKYGKTPGQVVLRYQVDRGHLLAPKSSNEGRLKENFDIFTFSLTKEEVDYISSLNRDLRLFGYFAEWTHLQEFPFNIEF